MPNTVARRSRKSRRTTPTQQQQGGMNNNDTNAQRQALGWKPIGPCLDAERDGDPDCAVCGLVGAGKHQCAKCCSVFYCSKECQISDWKEGGHKQNCAVLKAEAERVGKLVVALMVDDTLPLYVRLSRLEDLDGVAAYKVAVAAGLQDAMRELFAMEAADCLERFRSIEMDGHQSVTQCIMSTIFRGQRREGKGQTTGGTFRYTDSSRISKYVLSHENAFCTWFDATAAMFRSAIDNQVLRNQEAQAVARQYTRDIVAAWIMVFTRRKSAKAILLGRSLDHPSVSTVEYLATTLSQLLHERWATSSAELKDPNSSLVGALGQVAAMISYWTREFAIPLDFVRLLGFRDRVLLKTYKMLYVPVGEATIAKGSNLTCEEWKAVIPQHLMP